MLTKLHFQPGQRVEIALAGSATRLNANVVAPTEDGAHLEFTGQGLSSADVDRMSLTTVAELVKLTKADHLAFVKRVTDSIAAGDGLTPDKLASHHQCRLSRWYDGIADPPTLSLPAFQALAEPHRAVHDHGRKALADALTGDTDGAARHVAGLRQNSERVLACLDAFGQSYASTMEAGHDAEARAA